MLIADDHPLVCEALEIAVKSAMPGCAVDVVNTVAQAHDRVRKRTDYGLILLDLMLPDAKGFSGLILLLEAASPCPVCIVSARNDRETISIAATLGAAGFVDKATGMGQIAQSIRQLLAGEAVFPATMAPVRADTISASEALSALSSAQLKVMMALADGSSNKQIAFDLGLSESTVKAHVSASLKRLGVPNRARALLLLRPLVAANAESAS